MIGKNVSHYKILDRLGGGGMGVVYKAEDTLLKRTVALKFLPPELTADPEAKERFIHEAQAASSLEHANICSVHEIAEHEGQTFIVMGYYEGETLKKKVEDGRLKIEDCLDIAIQIAQGLTRAHEAGIVHRDIKPANVMITSHGEAKILDFGLARVAGRTMMTKAGTTLGTAAYMSPEQARGEQVDQRTDIWSLGVVFFEMLTGQLPFKSDYDQALVYAILNENPKPLRALRPDVPESVEQIVTKALAKEPQQRYQTARELLSDLRLARGAEETGSTIAATEALQRKKRKRLVRGSVISVIAVAVILLGLLVVWPMVQEQLLASSPMTIAVISFENQTGDKTQDHLRAVLQDAIITSLEQSKYIRVTTRQRIADILKQMGKKDVEYVDNELGLEICRREGAQLMAVGTFASAGELYRTTLKLVDVNTLETKQTYSTSGKGAESLLEKQIDDLSREVSRGIGLSERRTRETIRPVAEISTASIEAYQLYLRGLQEWEKFYQADARPYFEMAVQQDSLFAVAWYWVGNTRRASGDPKGAKDASARARSLAWRASEKEQYIIAMSDSSLRATLLGLPGLTNGQFLELCSERFPRDKEFLERWAGECLAVDNTDEAISLFKRALELDPTYGLALCNLGYAYASRKDWTNALETFKRYAAVSPGDANVYDSMGDIYRSRGMYNEAMANYKKALAVKSTWFISAYSLMWCDFIKERYAGALSWADTCATRGTGHQTHQMWYRAFFAFWLGRLNEAERLLAKRDVMLPHASQVLDRDRDFFGMWLADFLDMWITCERRQFARSRRAANSWAAAYEGAGGRVYRPIRELFVEMCHGFVELSAGDVDSAAARLARMDSIRAAIPQSDTTYTARLIVSNYVQYSRPLRSAWLLATGRRQDALAARSRDDARDRASGPIAASLGGPPLPVDLLMPAMLDIVPQGFLAMNQLDSSAAAYERAVDLSNNSWPIFPRYHYRLAQVYERKGLKEKAVAEYEKFLKIWGKADPIYKEPADARARLARLRRE